MFARLNHVDMDPTRFDEIDTFWRRVVESYEDLVCGYFLREGESPRTLSVVVFDSEGAMHANSERVLGEVVKQAESMRLNEPELHPLEVCAEIAPKRPVPPACARVASVALKPERAAEMIAAWPQGMSAYLDAPGFGGGMMCCDRKSGKTRSISFWGSRADLDAHERSGDFERAVAPYREMMQAPPESSYWDVRIVVRPGGGEGAARAPDG